MFYFNLNKRIVQTELKFNFNVVSYAEDHVLMQLVEALQAGTSRVQFKILLLEFVAHIILWSTHPLTEINARNVYEGIKAADA